MSKSSFRQINTHRITSEQLAKMFDDISKYLKEQNEHLFFEKDISKTDVYNFVVAYAHRGLVKEGQIKEK